MSELVSVIVPSFNMAEFLEGAISSVLAGEYERVEVVVVDDGSTDGTDSLMEAFTRKGSGRFDSRVRYVPQSNQGKSRAVNRGLRMARGSYITFLDADDELPRHSLSSRIAALYSEPADIAIGGFEVFDDTQVYSRREAPKTDDPKYLHGQFYTSLRTPFHLNACLMTRSLLARTSGFAEDLDRCVDGDFALKLLARGPRIALVDEPVYRYRKHRTSPTSRIRLRLITARDRIRVVWRHYTGIRRWCALPFAVVMDTSKIIYEAFTAAGRWS